MVDLPPEEAVSFREKCASVRSVTIFFIFIFLESFRMSYVPLIAPSTTLNRIKFLASIADSFIYVVSKVCHYTLKM